MAVNKMASLSVHKEFGLKTLEFTELQGVVPFAFKYFTRCSGTRWGFAGSYPFVASGRMSSFCPHRIPYGNIRVIPSLGWRHPKMEDWSARGLPPSSPVNFGQFYHRLINRTIVLSISLPEQLPDPFHPCFRCTIVVFMAIFLPLWFLLLVLASK